MQFNFTLSDLKKQLGDGLGIRSSHYAILVPLPYEGSKKLAILARSTSLPERNIGSVDLYHKGRRYKVRGETDLAGTYNISLTDDSKMNLRKYFDSWLRSVDDTTIEYNGIFNDESDGNFRDLINVAGGAFRAINEIASAFSIKGVSGTLRDSLMGNEILAPYQVDVDVYQLNPERKPIYGYRLQNCYPTEVGAVEITDETPDQLSMFNVTLTYSDFIPLDPSVSESSKIISSILGDSVTSAVQQAKTTFETLLT